MRVDFRQYFASAREKQKDNRRVLDNITKWKLQQWLVDGSLTLDEFNCAKWLWQPSGIPIFDPRTEIAAFETEIANGLNSRTNIALERGMDQREIFAQLAREKKEAARLDLDLVAGQPGQEKVGSVKAPENVEQEAKPEEALEAGLYIIDNQLVQIDDES